jgi:hypothetical protein
LEGLITGRANRVDWSFGDGSVLADSFTLTQHAWTNSGDYSVAFTAYNLDNPSGVSTNLVVHVVPLLAPTLSVGDTSGTNFRFSFFGQPGVSYEVEQTTN